MQIEGFPYAAVRFDRAGGPVDMQDVVAARQMIREEGVTDLLVLVHGWNNNMLSADALYTRLLAQMRALRDGELAGPLAGRRFGVVGLLWPSMRYTDAELIPGGAASSDPNADFEQALDEALSVFADDDDVMRPVLLKMKANPAVVEDKVSLQRELLEAVRHQLSSGTDADGQIPDENLQDLATVKERLAVNLGSVGAGDGTAASGLFSGALTTVRNLLNITTYYEMKARAALIGQSGALGLMRDLQKESTALKIHLIGHSFGGRLVSAMARGPDGELILPVHSLHLLQAAFSHQGFGEQSGQLPEGYFRRVLTERRVVGPILVSHTKNDVAVGMAYVIASALAGQNASSFGGRDDQYGAIGSNGALNADAHDIELTPDLPLQFEQGQLYNLHADFIANHSDIAQMGIVRAVLYGIAAT